MCDSRIHNLSRVARDALMKRKDPTVVREEHWRQGEQREQRPCGGNVPGMSEEQPGGKGARKAVSKGGVVGVEVRGHGRHEKNRAL